MQNNSFFYKDKPIFGFDIGYSTIKIMQVEKHNDSYRVVGYGVQSFDSKSIQDGVIVDFENIAESAKKLFKNSIIGEINTHRVTMSVPAAKTFTRTIELPLIEGSEIPNAVKSEAEQYIPIPMEELYFDHSVLSKNDKTVKVLAVATPRKIVDSQIQLAQILGLEPVGFDTSILAAARLFEKQDENRDIPAALVDFGSVSTDITIYDKHIAVTGTIAKGGDIFSETIARILNVSHEEAHVIKTKYGIGKSRKQKVIIDALNPILMQLAREVQRMIRYHQERSESNTKIGQVITMGGGANMPGLSEYLTNAIRLPVRTCEPLSSFSLNKLRPPSNLERSIYVTVAGLALTEPKELFVT